MNKTAEPAPGGEYNFTVDWLANDVPAWNVLLGQFQPKKIAEIGSFEGRSACHIIERCCQNGPIDLVCIDSWQGGDGLTTQVVSDAERRFDHNVAIAIARSGHLARVRKFKSFSHDALVELLHEHGRGSFDMIYVDGSHQAPDVLIDSVLAFQLLRVGGLMIFDDYLWSLEAQGQEDSLNMAKVAIDAFLNIFQRKMTLIRRMPLYQLYARKIAD